MTPVRTFIPHGTPLQLRLLELPDRLRILLQTLRPAEGVRATQRNPIDPTYCGMQLMNFRHQTGSGYTVAGARPKAACAFATGRRPSRAKATQRSFP
jgi:hypothetical protein